MYNKLIKIMLPYINQHLALADKVKQGIASFSIELPKPRGLSGQYGSDELIEFTPQIIGHVAKFLISLQGKEISDLEYITNYELVARILKYGIPQSEHATAISFF